MTGKNFVVYISFISTLLIDISFSQHQITAKPIIGLYLYNSENSLPVMGDENYLLNYGFEISYRNKNLFGYNIQVDYSYLNSGIDDVLKFVRTGEGSPDPIGVFYSDVSLNLNTFDISLNDKLGNIFSYGFGLSFSIINRSVVIEDSDFVDQLASFNIGLMGLIDVRIPFSKSNKYWYFYTGMKIRYLHGFFYDKGLRDLDNYSQNFVTSNLAIGLGYNF